MNFEETSRQQPKLGRAGGKMLIDSPTELEHSGCEGKAAEWADG